MYWYLYASPESIKDFEKKWNDLGAEVEKELQVSATQPDWLNNQKLVSETGLEKSKEEAWRAKIKKFEDDRIIVIFEGKKDKRPPLSKKGEAFVFLSIHGTLAQRQRQMAALDQIRRHLRSPESQQDRSSSCSDRGLSSIHAGTLQKGDPCLSSPAL